MEDDLRDLARYWDEGPWGWSLATKQRYLHMGIPECDLPTDEWLAMVRRLSSRQFAYRYGQQLTKDFGDAAGLVPCQMQFVTTVPETLPTTPMIGKAPWSSSGRGNLVINELSPAVTERLQGIIRQQGGVLMDHFYPKQTDFALEFWVEDGSVDYLGLSVFDADASGHYGGNFVESQSMLRQRIGISDALLQQLIDYHRQHLAALPYRGPVGIDMLLTTDGRVHPVIEINFRMTMGRLAILLHNQGICNDQPLTPPRQWGFVAQIEKGRLSISYLP